MEKQLKWDCNGKCRSCNASCYFEWHENTHLEQTEEHFVTAQIQSFEGYTLHHK